MYMNKKIRKIIALALATGTIIGGQVLGNNGFVIPAYASNDDADELSDITVEDDDGNEIDLYTDSDYDDELDDLEVSTTYYGESDTDKITIDIDGADEDCVRIFLDNNDYEVGDEIDLDDGLNSIKIRVYEDEYDDDEDYSSSDYNQYTLKINYEEDDDDDDNDKLGKIKFEDEDGKTIDIFKDEDYDDELDEEPDEGETYYAVCTTENLIVDSDVDDDYVRFIYDSDEYENGDEISLDEEEQNSIKIRVYDEEYDEDEEYDSSDYDQYIVKVYYDEDGEVNVGGSMNLSSLSLENVNIALNSSTTNYSNVVGNSTSSINIKAIPADTNRTVTINGTTVSQGNNYTACVNLNVGSNSIPIVVSKNNGTTKEYTLTVTRSAQTTVSVPSSSTTISNSNGRWVKTNGIWYYYNADGSLAKGWKYLDEQWYYMDSYGRMKTGWILTGGKWYYLYESGIMAANTTINGYIVGSDGAWIRN